MNGRALVCAVAGHRWREAADLHEPFPVLRCARCARLRKLAPGTASPEGWLERAGRDQRSEQHHDAGLQRRP